jgi:hypothetical protein
MAIVEPTLLAPLRACFIFGTTVLVGCYSRPDSSLDDSSSASSTGATAGSSDGPSTNEGPDPTEDAGAEAPDPSDGPTSNDGSEGSTSLDGAESSTSSTGDSGEGACEPACGSNATCVEGECACDPGSQLEGAECVAEDECATGNHRCGGLGGACTNGEGLGYTCDCTNGFVSSGGDFPLCYKSGTLTFGSGAMPLWAYRFMDETPLYEANFETGDFYVTDSDNFHTLWANNSGMRGVQRVQSDAPLLEVPIPVDGYQLFGETVLDGATYVSLAREPDLDYAIVLRVTELASVGFTFDWVLVYSAP